MNAEPEFPRFEPVETPPRNESEPWVDPLDNLPSFGPVPEEPQSNPLPVEPAWPPMESNAPVEMGVGFIRLPQDDEETFLRESGTRLRENLARELPFDAWDKSLEQERQASLAPRPYWERLSFDEKQRLKQELFPAESRTDYDSGPDEPSAEIHVGLEKHLPQQSTAREPLRYEIVVENRGREMIDAVDVDESVPATHQLTDVSPAGYFDDQLLRWRLKELRPGEKRRLQVEVVPTESGTIETTTLIRPSVQVASFTNVERTGTAPASNRCFYTLIKIEAVGV